MSHFDSRTIFSLRHDTQRRDCQNKIFQTTSLYTASLHPAKIRIRFIALHRMFGQLFRCYFNSLAASGFIDASNTTVLLPRAMIPALEIA